MDEKAKESLEYFEKAVELAPNSAHFINDLGVTYLRLNKLDEAEKMFLKGLEVDPDHVDLQKNLEACEEHIEFRDNQRGGDRFENNDDVLYKVRGMRSLWFARNYISSVLIDVRVYW